MARPYDLYCRFLVTTGVDDLEALNERLGELNLQPISAKELDAHYNLVQDSLPGPVLHQVENKKYEGDFLKWMKILEVDSLWRYEKHFRTPETTWVKLIYDLHQDPLLRLTLNALLTKAVKHQDICQDINMKHAALLKPEHVLLYEKAFWNTRRMTRKDWKEYLAGASNSERELLFTVLTEPVEVVKAKLELPSKVNISEALQFLFMSTYQKAKHYLKLSTKEANSEARAWIDETIKLADKYDKHRTGDLEDFSKALQMEFDYISADFPTPDEATRLEVQLRNKVPSPEGVGTVPSEVETNNAK